jgi:hypothetical protein
VDFIILHRMVGGFIGTGSTVKARLIWSLSCGLMFGFAACVHHMSLLCVVAITFMTPFAAYLGRLIPHSEFQGAPFDWEKFFGMSFICATRLLLLLLPTAIFEPSALWLVPLGIGGGVAYWIGWRFLDGSDSGFYYRHNAEQMTIVSMDHFAVSGGEWAEVLVGLLVYQFAFMALLVM